jgi:hypothetical protein
MNMAFIHSHSNFRSSRADRLVEPPGEHLAKGARAGAFHIETTRAK